MKKPIFCQIISIIMVLALAAACDFKQKSAILLSSEPIDMTNFQYVDRYPVFNTGQNIYFLLIHKDPIKNPKLRVQVRKLDKKGPAYGISVAYATDINRGSDRHYVTDYFVLRKAGDYVIKLFSHDKLQKPLAETEFTVEAL